MDIEKTPTRVTKDQLIQQAIDSQGFHEQNQVLVNQGFLRIKKNLKLLIKFNGHVDQVLEVLRSKQHGHHGKHHGRESGKQHGKHHGQDCQESLEGRPKGKWVHDELAAAGFQEQNAFLVSQGYNRERKNLKLLKKFNGDQELVIQHLKSKPSKELNWSEKDKRALQEIEKAGFISQHIQLSDMGYTQAKLNLKLLVRTQGNVEEAIDILVNVGGKHEKFRKERKEKKEKKEKRELHSSDPDIEGKLKQLEVQGYHKKRKNLELLATFGGDVTKVFEYYKAKEDKKAQRKENSLANEKIVAENVINSLDDPRLADVDAYYLDGNNMFFCRKDIRELCLKKQSKEAEVRLAQLIHERLSGLSNVRYVYLIFDNTSNTSQTQNFVVASARPEFQTSDDALVSIAQKITEKDKSVFVTSDRELLRRLKEVGITKFIKSKLIIQEEVKAQAQTQEQVQVQEQVQEQIQEQ